MSEQAALVSVLLAEYNAVRASSLMRDQNRNASTQFNLIILSAVVAGLPSALDRGLWLLLPCMSILLISLVTSAREQASLIWDLAIYEYCVLRPRIVSALGGTELPGGTHGIMGWQHFHVSDLKQRRLAAREGKKPGFLWVLTMRLLRYGHLGLNSAMIAVAGTLLAIFYERHLHSASPLEKIAFIVGLSSFILGGGHTLADGIQYRKRRRIEERFFVAPESVQPVENIPPASRRQ